MFNEVIYDNIVRFKFCTNDLINKQLKKTRKELRFVTAESNLIKQFSKNKINIYDKNYKFTFIPKIKTYIDTFKHFVNNKINISYRNFTKSSYLDFTYASSLYHSNTQKMGSFSHYFISEPIHESGKPKIPSNDNFVTIIKFIWTNGEIGYFFSNVSTNGLFLEKDFRLVCFEDVNCAQKIIDRLFEYNWNEFHEVILTVVRISQANTLATHIGLNIIFIKKDLQIEKNWTIFDFTEYIIKIHEVEKVKMKN